MIEIKEAAKAWATLITGLCAAVLAVGVDDTTGKILAIGVAAAGAVVTWAVGPPLATSALLPEDEYGLGYDEAMTRDEPGHVNPPYPYSVDDSAETMSTLPTPPVVEKWPNP